MLCFHVDMFQRGHEFALNRRFDFLRIAEFKDQVN